MNITKILKLGIVLIIVLLFPLLGLYLNDGIQGGFGPGDLTIVFGNPGGGKSWTMVAIAAHAVKMGL